jgi:SAM-dependent methyltransferase
MQPDAIARPVSCMWGSTQQGDDGQPKVARALATAGTNSGNIAEWLSKDLHRSLASAASVIDIGCGTGNIGKALHAEFTCAIDGVDIVKYDGFVSSAYRHHFVADLDGAFANDLPARYDVALAIEVIEHLENPRAFMRQAAALLNAGGLLVVTTPNIRSLSSLVAMVLQGHFRDFRDGVGMYPCHITPLSDLDALRVASELGLAEVEVRFSGSGRIPFSGLRYQALCPPLRGRLFSDTCMLLARTPGP